MTAGFATLPPSVRRALRAAILAAGVALAFPPPVFAAPAATGGDAVVQLMRRLARGELLIAGNEQAVLRTVLRELDVPEASQVLVFSRTSLQGDLIRPHTPRALYFSESTYVGWMPHGLLEIMALDPQTGGVEFYTFDPKAAGRGTFARDQTCMRCHGERGSLRDIPRFFAQSIVTTALGDPLTWHGVDLMDDKLPFERRWAGWYVTGYHGPLDHRGNAFGRERDNQLEFTPTASRPAHLGDFFDTSRYVAPTSDIVALLVLEHQMAVHNSLLHGLRVAENLGARSSTAAEVALRTAARDIVDHLLFRNAAVLPAGIEGSADFRAAFAADARRCREGRSLKDLSLDGRLLAHPLSFLVYSDAVLGLPEKLKAHLFGQLAAALQPGGAGGRYDYLPAADKTRIVEILRDTHPEARRYLGET